MRTQLLALVAATLVAFGCQTGPFGRNQLVAIPAAQEQKLGATAYQQVLAEEKDKLLSSDDAISRRVAEVGWRGRASLRRSARRRA